MQTLGESCEFAADFSELISFGPYDALLRSQQKDVIIITVMGAQSTGKSYLLNHIGGVYFDVAGGRCTDGVFFFSTSDRRTNLCFYGFRRSD